jgi:serine/threonine-protein kinase
MQKCPVCAAPNDVSVYVSGQQIRCVKCGLSFDVQRPDIQAPTRAAPRPPSGRPAGTHAPQADTMVLQALPSFPGYEVMEVIGKGGMGTVYKARQISLKRVVAIKVLAGELAVDRGFIDRFDREATALAKLSHPNIVPIIDKGAYGGVYFFVMDYVQGNTLRDLLRVGKLPQEDTVKISLQVCRALSHAHANGVVHRDMKPENVLMDRDKNVRIADFGLADIVGNTTWGTLTGSGMAMGTAHYMAPEQRKDAKRVDLKADIYSMGIMLYEMLTGEIPQGHFRRPSEHTPGVNPAFDNIVIRCLQPIPEDRYISSDELARDIRSVGQQGRRAEAPVPKPAARTEQPETPGPEPTLPQDAPAAPQPVQPAPQAFKAAPSFLPDGRRQARQEVRPISVRRRQMKKLRLAAFAAGTVAIGVAAVFIARACS